MKNSFAKLIVLSTIVLFACQAQANGESSVKQTLQNYLEYANARDVKGMSQILHEGFRSIGNQLFGGTEVSFTDKKTYLGMLEAKKIGGGDRKMTILDLNIEGKNANAKIKMQGGELTFVMYVLLVQTAQGDWKIISDLPHIIQ